MAEANSRTIDCLRSLAILAPKEITMGGTQKQPELWALKENAQHLFAIDFVDGNLSEADQDYLLCHLLRCIDARGWQPQILKNPYAVYCQIFILNRETITETHKTSYAEALLYAYVHALTLFKDKESGDRHE